MNNNEIEINQEINEELQSMINKIFLNYYKNTSKINYVCKKEVSEANVNMFRKLDLRKKENLNVSLFPSRMY